MRFTRTALLAGTVAVGFLTAKAGQTAESLRERPSSEIREARFSRLRGMSVENLDGERLGAIKDFVIDMRTGEAKFGLVAPSGWRNLRARWRIVPAPALSNATAKESTIALDVSLLQWKNAPRFRKSEVVELNDPARQREILSSYAPPKSRVTQAHPAPPPDEWRPPPVKARAADRPRGAAAEMKLASDLLGARLLDRSKQAVGRMSDLLIDLNGKKAAFAVVSESKLLKSKENFVTPLRALRLVGEGQLMIDAGDPAFEQARPFSEEAWQALGGRNGTTIYRVTE